MLVTARRFRDLQVSETELAPVQRLDATVRETQAKELGSRPVPGVAELVEADAEALWSDEDLGQEA